MVLAARGIRQYLRPLGVGKVVGDEQLLDDALQNVVVPFDWVRVLGIGSFKLYFDAQFLAGCPQMRTGEVTGSVQKNRILFVFSSNILEALHHGGGGLVRDSPCLQIPGGTVKHGDDIFLRTPPIWHV